MDTKITFPEEIKILIYKSYYSNFVLPIINLRKESDLYLKDEYIPQFQFALSPYSFEPSGIVNLSNFQVFATNFNVLRIMSGVRSFAYST